MLQLLSRDTREIRETTSDIADGIPEQFTPHEHSTSINRPHQHTPITTTKMAGPPIAAIKARIMAHMNTEHPDSLEDYLKFYNNINAAPQSAKMIDLDLDSLK